MVHVKYLKPEWIESATQSLLAEYGRKFGNINHPPIPVEEILEAHLELRLDFDDMAMDVNAPDALGATWFNEKRISIDSSLDPFDNPHNEGRYRFTLAHEIGHWELHRNYFTKDINQTSLFGEQSQPSIICTSSRCKEPSEWQADYFAGYLLMPSELVYKAWELRNGDRESYIAKDEMSDLSVRWGLVENSQPTVQIARVLARDFKVSGQAMQIRLIGLGLIKTEDPAPCFFDL